MAVKSMSTRASICGRGGGCKGGHSAVGQSSYISREEMYCEYDGLTYYPKYSEDLVYGEVLLPENAPEEFKSPSVLWNNVELYEKGSDAQLARTYKVEIPNEWSYELATEVMRDYIQRNFVDKGMCAQFAIHDSENPKTGQRNLHCHIMLTMRSLDEQGKWMPKQKKVYLTDENGERIPLIDKRTGQQKVDKQNRKQWKCATVSTNDWSSRENAKIWRKDLADTINAVNEKIGMTENFWEHRSFKDQGLDIIPQIHLGEKASAMERAGIRTIRGDINRDIIARNAVIDAARVMYEKAKEGLQTAKAVQVTVVKAIRNEILDVIRAVAERNNARLSLPIMGAKYFRLVSDRRKFQDKEYMEKFVTEKGFTTFDEMKEFKKAQQSKYSKIATERTDIKQRMTYLENLLSVYEKYEPYIQYHKEQWALKGFERKKYERKHIAELSYYDAYREHLKEMILEPDKKITAGAWKKELATLEAKYEKGKQPYAEVVTDLACVEVLQHNKKDLDRLLQNERNARERQTTKRRDEPSL